MATARPRRGISTSSMVAATIVAAAATTGAASGQDVPVIFVQIQHFGYEVDVSVNGLPVASSDRDDTTTSTLIAQLSPYLVDGPNRVEVAWERVRSTDFPLEVEVRRNTDTGSVDVAPSFTLPESAETAGTHTVSVEASIPVRWSWLDAEPLPALTAQDRADIVSVLRGLHGAYASGDLDRLFEITNTLFSETALLREGALERLRERYASIMASPEWSMMPFDASALSFERHDRLVRVTAPEGVIRSGPVGEGGRTTLRLGTIFFAKIDGRWVPVRSTG